MKFSGTKKRGWPIVKLFKNFLYLENENPLSFFHIVSTKCIPKIWQTLKGFVLGLFYQA